MNSQKVLDLFLSNFDFVPTKDQSNFLREFAKFSVNEYTENVFILRGYAGTGKTTLVKTLVTSMPKIKLKTILLAPTGRAAKVLSNYSGQPASTIHRRIYRQNDRGAGDIGFSLIKNKSTNTIFIVAESSMISGNRSGEDSLFKGTNLLDDLISFTEDGENCKLLFIGDVAQLPPVGEKVSPSLSQAMMRSQFGCLTRLVELKEVMRQAKDSGILENATVQRTRLIEGIDRPLLKPNQKDVLTIVGFDLQDYLETSYSQSGIEDTILICRSNKRANQFNQEIRARMLFREQPIETSDLLMVVKNNYFWIEPNSPAGFIANGDTIEVLKVLSIEEKYELQFAHCEVRLTDYPTIPEFECKVIMDTLQIDGPALPRKQSDQLYQCLQHEYGHIKNKQQRFLKIKEDPYYNALQVKFAYAVTCHKAQGGQWKDVYVDQGYVTTEMLGTEYMRWIYTALTRASEKLFLLNFSQDYLVEQDN